ncbi:MAG: type II toxin-antitoxin system VapC family toxin [Acidimicrobiia bacterium]
MSAWYLDTSAFMKLVVRERQSAELTAWLNERREDEVLMSSDLLRTEARRTARRAGDDGVLAQVLLRLETMDLIPIARDTFDDAGVVEPRSLRALDAIHLVSAQALLPDLRGIVTYDRRLSGAAAMHGIEVVSPGAA